MPTIQRIYNTNSCRVDNIINKKIGFFLWKLRKSEITLEQYNETAFLLSWFSIKKKSDFWKRNIFIEKEEIESELNKLLKARNILLL